ncbi:hypothetical protein AUC43_04785 [Hymenobacter sedentarius]|uniref:Uncharacterized protein n=1 Tax=Hymenobacter sedentarius TaxID=1411621 RepID=A0A0U4C2T2_9BACT|nr:hypothetical protein AUC43_04785 [Hymenobacter sedentarius]
MAVEGQRGGFLSREAGSKALYHMAVSGTYRFGAQALAMHQALGSGLYFFHLVLVAVSGRGGDGGVFQHHNVFAGNHGASAGVGYGYRSGFDVGGGYLIARAGSKQGRSREQRTAQEPGSKANVQI